MSYVGLTVIVSMNSVLLFFASLLAAGGDGSAAGVRVVWLLGYFRVEPRLVSNWQVALFQAPSLLPS